VTLGKPMGNGYRSPRRDPARARRAVSVRGRTFSTFGGNPVAAAAALAVLDALEDERLPERGAGVGERLRTAVETLRKPDVVEVRGRGLLAGIQLSSSELATRVTEELREHGILVGRTGKHGDVLKIRPPLVFTDEHAGVLVGALDRILG
jgi:4-aminobutyrate aminotransferase-like enzyme